MKNTLGQEYNTRNREEVKPPLFKIVNLYNFFFYVAALVFTRTWMKMQNDKNVGNFWKMIKSCVIDEAE